MSPNARDGSVRPLSFRKLDALHQSGVDPTAEAAIRAGDVQRRILVWSGKKTATLYRVTAPADPVLVHGNRLCGAKGPQPVPFIAVWKSDLVGSVSTHSMRYVRPAAIASHLASTLPTRCLASEQRSED